MRSLGDYLLTGRLGRGGAGEVFGAIHLPTGTPAAVKRLHAAGGDAARQAVADEVRAVARLDHPNVVAVYDHGLDTPADGPARPWIAMERAAGALDRAPPPADWPALHRVLTGVLRALAHAHARGVIHRDVKPGNVLLAADGGVRLSDFGIARALDREEPESPTWLAGTPQYAAPEQLARIWRRQGPATDLYALGCLAWELATGAPVFPGLAGTALARAQAWTVPGPFLARVALPPAFEAWVRTLLEKDPRGRPESAAAALGALPGSDAPTDGEVVPGGAFVSAPTAVPSATFRLDSAPTLPSLGAAEPPATDPPVAPARPVPPDWRPLLPPPRARPIPLGPALFGWRDPPPVGREAERDVLWAALREGADARRVVIVEGPAGVGKSRLARWLVETVEEAGLGRAWRATHGPTAGPQDGLEGMLARAWRTAGLDRAALPAHLVRLTGAAPPDLVDLLLGEPLPRADRHRAVTTALGPGPVLVWLDDVQWGADALHWAEAWLADGPPGLVVATLRADEPAPPGLEAVRAHPATRVLPLGHLGQEGQARLVDALVALSPELARRVVDHTDGHPLFAVELVGDWVRRGALVPSASGYTRPDDAPALEIPDGIHALWQGRLARLGLDEGRRAALEAVAALGRAAPRVEWRSVGLDAASEELLRGAGLLRRTPDGLELVHGLLRDSVAQEAARAGRWTAAHARAAEALALLGAAPARVGRHLFAAERWDAAVEPLRRGADLARLANELDVAEALLADAATAARRVGGEGDPRLPAVWMLTAWVQQLRGQPGPSGATAERAWALADRLGRARDAGDAAWVRAEAARAAGDAAAVEWWLDRAEGAYTTAHHLEGLSDVARVRGALESMRGDVARARAHIARALGLGRESDAPAAVPNTQLVGSAVEARAGDWEAAFTLAEAALAGFAAIGSRVRETHARIALAELARRTGRWEEAESALRTLDAALGPGASARDSVRLNLALLLLDRGQTAEAARRLQTLAEETRAPGHYALMALAWLGLAELSAHAGDWEAVADRVEAWAARTSPSGIHADPDAAGRLARLEDAARGEGQARLAARIRQLAARSVHLPGRPPER